MCLYMIFGHKYMGVCMYVGFFDICDLNTHIHINYYPLCTHVASNHIYFAMYIYIWLSFTHTHTHTGDLNEYVDINCINT